MTNTFQCFDQRSFSLDSGKYRLTVIQSVENKWALNSKQHIYITHLGPSASQNTIPDVDRKNAQAGL